MPRTTKAATAIPAHVTLRALRDARGLTARALADLLEQRGVKVSTDHIIAVELGQSGAGTALRVAWADELRINPRDIHMAGELREIVYAADGESDEKAKAAA
jgi:transcriptional regulator with XRE-family HTH domain